MSAELECHILVKGLFELVYVLLRWVIGKFLVFTERGLAFLILGNI